MYCGRTKAEEYSEPCQTSEMKRIAKIVNGLKPLAVFTKHSFLDVWQGVEYASEKLLAGIPQNLSTKIFLNSQENTGWLLHQFLAKTPPLVFSRNFYKFWKTAFLGNISAQQVLTF